MSMVPKPKKPPVRQRRTSLEARTLALVCARRLLLSQGPNAITLQSVAGELGMSHTNLIHHFGSAAGLQTALMQEMVSHFTATIQSAVAHFRAGEGDIRDFVDVAFDAFGKGGAGQLAAWIVLSGEARHLAPVGEAVRSHMNAVERGAPPGGDDSHQRVTAATLLLTVAAFGDAMIGSHLREMLGCEDSAVRKIIADLLANMLSRPPA